jgi:hypothetical protein
VCWAGKGESVIWSTKAYLGRSPTKSEAVTLSKRVKNLVDSRVLSRSGRDIKLTPIGRRLLYEWTIGKQDIPLFEGITLLLELNELMDEATAVFNVLFAGCRHLEDEAEANALARAIRPLGITIGFKFIKFCKRVNELEER